MATDEQLEKARSVLLPHLPQDAILTALSSGAGDELEAKFSNPESSAALAVNTLGFFLNSAPAFPALACLNGCDWPALEAGVEQEMRFPWAGGTHPWLDAAIRTKRFLIGVESKRYEPFRPRKAVNFSSKYSEHDWGADMQPFAEMRDGLLSGEIAFRHLDAVQLVKHSFGLHAQAAREGRKAILLYLYAAPQRWPDGRNISAESIERHAAEIDQFNGRVAGADVEFRSCGYATLLDAMSASRDLSVRDHAAAIRGKYGVL
jgi:hypothetical protein